MLVEPGHQRIDESVLTVRLAHFADDQWVLSDNRAKD